MARGALARLAALLALLALAGCGSSSTRAVPSAGPRAYDPLLNGVRLSRLEANPELCYFTLGQGPLTISKVVDRPLAAGCGYQGALEIADARPLAYNRSFIATCRLAAALAIWQQQVVEPAALQRFGQPVDRIEHWGTYACRNRNSRQGGPRSEHATANAIDVAAFVLADGTMVSVKEDWGGWGDKAAFLRQVHDGACKVFNGILGPDANAEHRDHFHLDMGRWRFCE
ncbi:Uncharacterized conserved protein [Tistlia consotensis]|uniref:Uncharacterized conserved protein n=1 Tax=Tistlia consotensis USBA 355 TaxID=560819 RepID=A0A1Y6CHV0_9PROT|nr:extensin family protein [Tistlia consotensis]SMF54007.1 Uncharacterized conserved protein [Tistlia consotensis USBA 355]SNR86383.1 Uncharacterized conserved protein [Tistlia consotensis]